MTLLHAVPVTVWCEGGVPYGLVWDRRHYRVTDTPTRLEEFASSGWRFQGTDDDEHSRMFDIALREGVWELLRTFE